MIISCIYLISTFNFVLNQEAVSGDSLIAIAYDYYQNGAYSKAIIYEKRAAAYFEALGAPERSSNSLNDVGLYYFLLGDYDSSLLYYQKALALDLVLSDSSRQLRRYKNIGIVYERKGRHDQALDYYFKAAAIGRNIGDSAQIARLSNEIGIIYKQQNRLALAIPHLHEALKIFQRQNDTLNVARALNNLGGAQLKLDVDSAIWYFSKSLKIKRVNRKYGNLGTALQNLGEAYQALFMYDSAEHYYRSALDLKLKEGNPQLIIYTANHLVNLALLRSRFKEANEFLAISEGYFFQATSRNLQAEYYLLKSRLFDSLNQPLEAYEYYRKWNVLQDSLFQTERLDVLNQLSDYEKEVVLSEKELAEKELQLAQQENEQRALRVRYLWGTVGLISVVALAISWLAFRIRKQRNHIEFLLKGFHHGIKNHLQIISALLEAQADISEEQISKSLREAQIRIEAVVGIYRRLYLKNEFQYVGQQEYLEELVDNTAMVFGYRNVVDKRVNAWVNDLDAETSIMMGLIINEVLTNAFKHGLQEVTNPVIEIDLEKKESMYYLHIADNSLIKQLPATSIRTFGMQLIQSLSATLKAAHEFQVNNGLHFYLNFQLVKRGH